MQNLENGWVNTVLKEKKTKIEGKPTHYLEVDNWKPEAKQAVQNTVQQPIQDDLDDSLPF